MSGDEPQALAKVERAPQSLLEKLGLTAEQFTALDVDKMQRLLDFSLQVEAETARRAYEAAFERAQNRLVGIDIPKLTKGARTGSRYAKTEAISRVLDPVLVDEGFTWTFSDADSAVAGHVKIVMRLRNSGHTEPHDYNAPAWDGRGPQGSGVMTPLEASGAIRTYSERRLRMSVFGLHLVDDDTDGAAGGSQKRISADQVADLRSTIQEVGSSEPMLLVSYKLDRLEDMTEAVLAMAHHALEQRRRISR